MIEMKRFSSFSMNEIGRAFEELENDNLPCAVFTDMAAGTHDDLVDLHNNIFSGAGNRLNNQSILHTELRKLGWDLDSFSEQPIPDRYTKAPDVSITTIDLIEPNSEVSWHQDIINGPGTDPDSPISISLPIGFGLSLNLVNTADIYVEDYDRTEDLIIPCGKLAIAQIIIDAQHGTIVDKSDHTILHARLLPGDAVIWRQPYAHKVLVPSHYLKSRQRRSITAMRELVFDAVDTPVFT